MGSTDNEARPGAGAPAAKPKRGGPGLRPGAGPRESREFDGMSGPKGRWMFSPPDSAGALRDSLTSNDSTITSVGGRSDARSSESTLSGNWILKPLGSLESIEDVVKAPQRSEPGLSESSARKSSRKKRPGAPKPRVRRRSLMRHDSLLAVGSARAGASRSSPAPAPAPAPAPLASELERERDALAISSAVNLAWREWDLPTHALPSGAAERKVDSKELVAPAKVSKIQLGGQGQSRPEGTKTLVPDVAKEKPGSDRSSESDKGTGSLSSKKSKSDHPHPEGRLSVSPDIETKDDREEGPTILPRFRGLRAVKKDFLTPDVCPAGVCEETTVRRPSNVYCPWHPNSLIDAWGSQRPNFPGWMSVDEEEKVSRKIRKEKPLPCSPRKSKHVVAAMTCGLDQLPPKTSKVKSIKGTKTLRPEVRRWLAGYPQNSRFRRETLDLIRNAPDGISVELDEANERHIFVDMLGPEQSLYEGGLFRIEVFFPGEYPRDPPKLRFMTKIYHPNVDKLGRIRLPEIEEKWSPALLLREVLCDLQKLLTTPNVAEPIAIDVARRWFWQEDSAQQTARLWTRKFAHRHSAAAWLDCRCDCCCEQLAAVSAFI